MGAIEHAPESIEHRHVLSDSARKWHTERCTVGVLTAGAPGTRKMRYALHFDNPTERLGSFVIEATSDDPRLAQEQLREGVSAANAAFTRRFGMPLMIGGITMRCEWLGTRDLPDQSAQ